MTNIYMASIECMSIRECGLPGYVDVVLSVPLSTEPTIVINGTCARFKEGKQYLVAISELDEEVKTML